MKEQRKSKSISAAWGHTLAETQAQWIARNSKERKTMYLEEDREPRENRSAVRIPQFVFDELSHREGAWYETPDEVAAGLDWGRRRALLMRWVRRHMARRLTQRERRCIELYYLFGLNHRQVGAATGTAGSSACRAIARGLRKLRLAAEEDPTWRRWWRPRRTAPLPSPGRRRVGRPS